MSSGGAALLRRAIKMCGMSHIPRGALCGLLVLMTFASTPALAGTRQLARPAVLFTDVVIGPATGGPGNAGVPIAIFGRGFGASRGASTVTINGIEVATYLQWGENNAVSGMLDMIVVQPGASVTGGAIVVTVNGVASSGNATFTPSGGAIYAVAPDGADANPCSLAQPCATIEHAVRNVLKPADALLVRGGPVNDDEVWIRDEHGHSGSATKPKIIRNDPGEAPFFAKTSRPVILHANHLVWSGFRFPGGKSLGVGTEQNRGLRVVNNVFEGGIGYDAIGSHGDDHVIAGNTCNASGSSVGTQGHCYYISAGSNLEILYNTGSGVPGYVIHIFDQKRGTPDFKRVISNVRVEGNLLRGSTQRSGMIIAMADEGALGNVIDGVSVRNNIFTGNNHGGLQIGGIVKNVRIEHNTFSQNGRFGVAIYNEATVQGVTLTNNLIEQSDNAVCASNCDWWPLLHIDKGAASRDVSLGGNFYAPGPPLLRGISDPGARAGAAGFVNAASRDFHLTAGAAPIDTGQVLTPAFNDFDGQARPAGAKPDPGAFEFGSGAPPAATRTPSPTRDFGRPWVFVPVVRR